MDLLYDIGGLLTSPGTTYKIIVAEKRGIGSAIVVLVLFSIGCGAATAASMTWLSWFLPKLPFVGDLFTTIMVYLVLGFLVYDMVSWIIDSALAYGFARALGEKGAFTLTLVVYGYSWVGRLFYIIPALFGLVWRSPLGMVGLLGIGVVLSTIAKVVLQVKGVSIAHELSTGRSALAVLLSLAIKIAVIAGGISIIALMNP